MTSSEKVEIANLVPTNWIRPIHLCAQQFLSLQPTGLATVNRQSIDFYTEGRIVIMRSSLFVLFVFLAVVPTGKFT